MDINTKYDYNVWSDSAGSLTLTAYQQYYDASDGNWIRTNTVDNYQSITYTFPEDLKSIEFLLKDLYVNQYPLTDYDDWVNNPWLFFDDAPDDVWSFLHSLPDYELPRKNL